MNFGSFAAVDAKAAACLAGREFAKEAFAFLAGLDPVAEAHSVAFDACWVRCAPATTRQTTQSRLRLTFRNK